ncbi:unnamed protein product [Phyllotreta striolata]|uniref:Kinase suppressor of Ras 2 n=1 Tax=Phyllotreta striolata TaxID=444603 RepID=A0A9N9TJD9_PHYSR|nr:unnamed protein product [Phyllotreta striolata]
MADEGSDQELRKTLHMIQSMIDVSAQRLEGLRTQCATSAELTQQEIRTLEAKLITMFSEQLVIKLKIKSGRDEHIPSLTQWLQVVGLEKPSIFCLCQKLSSVEELQEKTDFELKTILLDKGSKPEEFAKLCRALHNLKRYVTKLKKGDADSNDISDLHWDSWVPDHNHQVKTGLSPRPGRSRAARTSVPSEESLGLNNNNNRGGAIIPPSSSVSSIDTLNAQCNVLGPPLTPPGHARGKANTVIVDLGSKFPTTPPARRRHQTGNVPTLLPEYPLTKSKSHESQLAAGKGEADSKYSNGTGSVGRRGRLPTEPGPDTMGYSSPLTTSPIKSPPYNHSSAGNSDDGSYKSISLSVPPKSPRTPTVGVGRIMTHQISHRFTKTFKMMSSCGYCQKPIFGKGLKCKECNYTCHRDCEDKVTPSCGLPAELLNEFKKNMTMDGGNPFISPTPSRATGKTIINLYRRRKNSHPQNSINTPPFPPPDSSSNTSSCNSSTPSSPAVQILNTPQSSQRSSFHFPDVTVGEPTSEVTLETHPLPPAPLFHRDVINSQQMTDSERTASQTSESTSTDSDKTPVRVDSQDSQVSDSDTITDGHRWPRQNSLSMREWDIPFDELKMNDVIGKGRFCTVYRGQWHGDVAVKVLNVIYLKDEKTLDHFKNEVSTFRKTRHENLILFMGACMKPPKLAIVTSLSKGMTLYTHIHLRKDKFNMNKTTNVAQQISQGMGYLHAKGIIHKDLKSKNIFIENGKVVITDFGLFSVTKLCFGNKDTDSLGIPPGWLCYLAPEIMKSLHAHQPHDEELPFSKASDVYAFGTVWYELLCGEWPFKGQPPEAVIWQVGKGMKQPLANLQASRDVKDILMLCWSFHADDRPDFVRLLNILDKLPKKRLARSPSHPIHLSRSAESVF